MRGQRATHGTQTLPGRESGQVGQARSALDEAFRAQLEYERAARFCVAHRYPKSLVVDIVAVPKAANATIGTPRPKLALFSSRQHLLTTPRAEATNKDGEPSAHRAPCHPELRDTILEEALAVLHVAHAAEEVYCPVGVVTFSTDGAQFADRLLDERDGRREPVRIGAVQIAQWPVEACKCRGRIYP